MQSRRSYRAARIVTAITLDHLQLATVTAAASAGIIIVIGIVAGHDGRR